MRQGRCFGLTSTVIIQFLLLEPFSEAIWIPFLLSTAAFLAVQVSGVLELIPVVWESRSDDTLDKLPVHQKGWSIFKNE